MVNTAKVIKKDTRGYVLQRTDMKGGQFTVAAADIPFELELGQTVNVQPGAGNKPKITR